MFNHTHREWFLIAAILVLAIGILCPPSSGLMMLGAALCYSVTMII